MKSKHYDDKMSENWDIAKTSEVAHHSIASFSCKIVKTVFLSFREEVVLKRQKPKRKIVYSEAHITDTNSSFLCQQIS